MESNNFKVNNIKIFGQTNYEMCFSLEANGHNGHIQVSAIEKFVLFGIELEGKTIVYDGYSGENNFSIKVKTDYLTRIASKSIELQVTSDNECAGIKISEITMSVIMKYMVFVLVTWN